MAQVFTPVGCLPLTDAYEQAELRTLAGKLIGNLIAVTRNDVQIATIEDLHVINKYWERPGYSWDS